MIISFLISDLLEGSAATLDSYCCVKDVKASTRGSKSCLPTSPLFIALTTSFLGLALPLKINSFKVDLSNTARFLTLPVSGSISASPKTLLISATASLIL